MTTQSANETSVATTDAVATRIPLATSSQRRASPGIAWQNLKTSFPLFVADGAGLFLAATTVYLVSGLLRLELVPPWPLFAASWPGIVVGFLAFGLYPGCGLTAPAELRQTTLVGMLVFLGFGIAWFVHAGLYGGTTILIFAIVTLLLIPLLRTAVRRRCAGFGWWTQPVLVLGQGPAAHRVFDAIDRDRKCGLRPAGPIEDVGFLDDDDPGATAQVVQKLADEYQAHRIIIPGSSPLLSAVCGPRSGMTHVHILADWPEVPTLWSQIGERAGLPEFQLRNRLSSPAAQAVKRTMDIALPLMAAPFVVPLICFIAAIIKTTSPGPIFFKQRRLGEGGLPFFAWKFRTMVTNAESVLAQCLAKDPELRAEWEQDHKLKKDPRVTVIGAILRKTSLDELPQLWNVLVGEMSLVGPRPIVDDEIVKYRHVYASYKTVRPGITGLWQISGRNNTTYTERIEYDQYYVRNWSPWLDAYILLRTVKTVILREGAY